MPGARNLQEGTAVKVSVDESKLCILLEPETNDEREDLVRRLGPFDERGAPTERSRLYKQAAEFDGKSLRVWPREA